MTTCVLETGQQNSMETEEECAVNKLMREIEELRAREQTTIQQMEAEEDRLAVSFAKHIESMRKEREVIVNSMESESEAVVNRMLQHNPALASPGEPPAKDE